MASCPVCAHEGVSIERLANDDAYDVKCRRCKAYVIDGDLLASCRSGVAYDQNFPLPAHEMSGIVRNAAERDAPLRLSFKTLDAVLKANPVPTDFHDRCDLLLLHIAKLAGTNHHGLFEVHVSLDASIAYATSCKPYLSGLIEDECIEAHAGKYRIRSPGWRRVKEASGAKETKPAATSTASTLQVAMHFEIEGKIGSGADAKVFRAWDTQLQRTVALKFFEESKAIEPLVVDHARIMAKVKDPCVVVVYTSAFIPHPETGRLTPAIVMEHVEGVELQERLGTANTLADLERIGLGMINGVAAFHKVRWAHGDLHDQNVRVSDGAVKVLDPARFTTASLASTSSLRFRQEHDVAQLHGLLSLLLRASPVDMQMVIDFEQRGRRVDLETLRTMFLDSMQPFAGIVLPPSLPRSVIAGLVKDVEALKIRPQGRSLTPNSDFSLRRNDAPKREIKGFPPTKADEERAHAQAAARALVGTPLAKPSPGRR